MSFKYPSRIDILVSYNVYCSYMHINCIIYVDTVSDFQRASNVEIRKIHVDGSGNGGFVRISTDINVYYAIAMEHH